MTATTRPTAGGSILGNPVPRVEDPRILPGEAQYFDDLAPDGCVHVVFVRSTIAHAQVTSIDIERGDRHAGCRRGRTHDTLAVGGPSAPRSRRRSSSHRSRAS